MFAGFHNQSFIHYGFTRKKLYKFLDLRKL